MKTNGYKWMMVFTLSVCAVSVSAQQNLTVKVKNVRSTKGKVLIATDKGQSNMVDATGDTVTVVLQGLSEGTCKLYVYHDENGNYQLDKKDGTPVENCNIAELNVAADTKMIEVTLKDLRKE